MSTSKLPTTAQKLLKADSLINRYRGGISRLQGFAKNAMKSAWTDNPSGGPSHELESLYGAIESMALMPAQPLDDDDRASSQELIEGFDVPWNGTTPVAAE